MVYLLHFNTRYKHAGHYLGSTCDLAARLALHAAGRGARLLHVVQAAGITWRLARTWAIIPLTLLAIWAFASTLWASDKFTAAVSASN